MFLKNVLKNLHPTVKVTAKQSNLGNISKTLIITFFGHYKFILQICIQKLKKERPFQIPTFMKRSTRRI